MAFKAMNQGWGEASTLQSIFRELAYATDGTDEPHDERTVYAGDGTSTANDDDAEAGVGTCATVDEVTGMENAAGV